MPMIFRILTRADWGVFQSVRVFRGTAHDLRDGFIHFSAAHQVQGTAEKHYAGQGELVLLHVDSERLAELTRAELKWEPSRGGDLFPHLYGELPIEAVEQAEPYPTT